MTPAGTAERLLLWALRRFHRLWFSMLGLGFGLLWAMLGLSKAMLVAALTMLGYLVGKWFDEGHPDGGLGRRWRAWFHRE